MLHNSPNDTTDAGPLLERAADAPVWRQTDSPTLARVMAGELCAGCGLCAGIAPDAVAMQLSPDGFARPYPRALPLAASQEAHIAAACPGNIVAPWVGSGAAVDPYWGPIRQCAEGHAQQDDVRFNGSSGGMLSALAIHALEEGLVDAVVHVVADPLRPVENRLQLSVDRAGVMAAAGSRYGPSPVLMTMETLLADTRRFLIIGKPCDISALRQLAKVDPRVEQRFRWMLSFFCGGMPSLGGTDAIINAMGLTGAELVRFRYRGNGWPGSARAEATDGRSGEMSYATSWGRYLSSRVQYRCKICPDAVGGSADIAAADAWYGGESGYPQFDERDGRSLVLTRTEAGAELLDSAVATQSCEVKPLAISAILLMQPSQARRKRLIVARTLAARVFLQPVPIMRGLRIGKAAAMGKWFEHLRNFLGSARRIIRGQR